MPISTFHGIETALRGLEAQQRALDITGHNIANANTPGYTRRVADLTESPALYDPPAGMLGTGVDAAAYQRIRDGLIDYQARGQGMLLGYQTARRDGLAQVELALGEPSASGLSSALDSFWSSWQDLGNAPTSMSARQALLGAASSLADGLRNLHSRLTQVDADTQTGISMTVADLNATVQQVATLDGQLMAQKANGQAPDGDLLDKRDLLLDKLSSLTNVAATNQPDGSVTLAIGSFTLLAGGAQTTVGSVTDLGSNLTSGKLAGLVALDATIAGPGGYLAKVDAVAAALISSVNAKQAAGYALDGLAATQPFFTGTDASTIAVAATLLSDSRLIGAGGQPGQPGNGDNARTIANLRGDASIDGAYQQLVIGVGTDSRNAQQSASIAQTLSDSLENKRQSVSGVSIDEEMANLVRFQRGYQAAARALTTMDVVLATLIERTGRVGI